MNYPWQQVNPKDFFTLRQVVPLSDQDVRILTTIYQPLIGNAAFTLYMNLKESIRNGSGWTEARPLSELMTLLDIGIPELYQARIRLEGLGLLSVYKSKKDSDQFLFEIKPPLSAERFFNDHLMRLILFEKVGERMFNEIKQQFSNEKPEAEEYEEITKSFLDVYYFDIQKHNQLSVVEFDDLELSSSKHSPVQMMSEQSDFDWTFFVEGLNHHFINKKSLTKEIRELIISIYEIYGVNELDMQKYVLESTDIETSNIDQEKLPQIVQRDFHKKQARKVQIQDKVTGSIQEEKSVKSGRKTQLKQKGFNNQEIEIILHAQEVKPIEYLKSIKNQKGGFVSSNETWVIKELVEQSSLSTSVINILINYVLIGKNAPVLEKSLALKVANDWAQNDINSPEDALQKVKQLYAESRSDRQSKQRSGSTRSNSQKYIRKETLPDWATEENVGEEIDAKKQEEFRQRLERIRNRSKGGDS